MKIFRPSPTLIWALSDQDPHLPQYKLSSPISQLLHKVASCNKVFVFISYTYVKFMNIISLE